jgi:hypothetical protein
MDLKPRLNTAIDMPTTSKAAPSEQSESATLKPSTSTKTSGGSTPVNLPAVSLDVPKVVSVMGRVINEIKASVSEALAKAGDSSSLPSTPNAPSSAAPAEQPSMESQKESMKKDVEGIESNISKDKQLGKDSDAESRASGKESTSVGRQPEVPNNSKNSLQAQNIDAHGHAGVANITQDSISAVSEPTGQTKPKFSTDLRNPSEKQNATKELSLNAAKQSENSNESGQALPVTAPAKIKSSAASSSANPTSTMTVEKKSSTDIHKTLISSSTLNLAPSNPTTATSTIASTGTLLATFAASTTTSLNPTVTLASKVPSNVKDRFNHASFDCGALILSSNREASSATSILLKNKDQYMLNRCDVPKKFVDVELCDTILVDGIVLANFEYFASTFKELSISVAERYPPKEGGWLLLGNFTANNFRDIQVGHP